METHEIKDKKSADWNPETNRLVQAVVGKLGEEAAELAKVCCRISIQGLQSLNPTTEKLNIRDLEDEIADVRALAHLAAGFLNLDWVAMFERKQAKMDFKKPWFDRLKKLEEKKG